MKEIRGIVRQAFAEWWALKTGRLAGALAFYSVLSLAPTVIIVIAVAGAIFGQEAVRAEILRQMTEMVGPAGAEVLRTVLQSADQQSAGRLASILGLATSAVAATAVFAELQDGLNTIWRVEPKERGLLHVIRHRLLSFAMVLVIGFLLLVSLVLSAAISVASHYFGEYLFAPGALLQAANFVVSFAITTALFAMIYKVLPDASICWSDVWAGAAISALLFSVGKSLIGFYLGTTSVSSVYGAAGSLVLLLLWVYYSAHILYLGAEFTEAYAERVGSGIRPKEYASASRASQG